MNFPLPTFPIVKDLLLLGGGHSHVAVLRFFAMRPILGVRVTLVSERVDTPYSGMLPGLIAGHYAYDDAHIDLQRLARFAGARAVFDEAMGLDLPAKKVRFRDRPPMSYDLLSIDIGSTPNLSVPGAAEHAVAVKPIGRFLNRWSSLRDRLDRDGATRRIAVVGGGAGGVELLLSVQFRIQPQAAREGARGLEFHLFTNGPHLLPTHNRFVRGIFEGLLRERGVVLHLNSGVTEVASGRLRTADGRWHEVDEVLWATAAAAPPWLAQSGLAVDEAGFVRVSDTLQSISHPEVFAAGDIASMVDHARPKSGVFAVRQGLPLARNLRRALLGERLEAYRPQRRFLSLISTGNQYAVASRGPVALQGAWVWTWKDWIDRRFMRRYNELPEMPVSPAPEVPAGLAGHEAIAAVAASAMRCGGCGAKVGASVLGRVLQRMSPEVRPDVVIGLEAPDDAAIVATSGTMAAVHTVDFFRSMIDDPYVFGRVAAAHALSDVYAMGASPETALAVVTIPHGPEAKVEETLTHLMAGAAVTLREAGVSLIGGHTSEGAELGLGFSVNGSVDTRRVLRKRGLRPGDRLVLTKAIGTGTLFAADMRARAKGRWIASAIDSMLQLNREASCCLLRHGVTACTDVSGFGLLGHLVEMLRASGVDAEVNLDGVSVLEGAEQTVASGILSSLQPENVRLRRAIVDPESAARHARFPLLFDPQTSGGLLAGVPEAAAEACVAELRSLGYLASAVIGAVTPCRGEPGAVTVTR